MKKKIIGKALGRAAMAIALCAAGSAGAASAADLGGGPRQPIFDDGPPRLAIEKWTGFYLGGTIGRVGGHDHAFDNLGEISLRERGIVATALAGYNWQLGSMVVVGLETDLGTGNVRSRTNNLSNLSRVDTNAIGSFRARAGLLVTPGLLLYATGGYAYADTDFRFADGSHTSKWLGGTQLGFGGELKLNPQWALRLEYIHTHLDAANVTAVTTPTRIEPNLNTVRAGVTFKF